MVKKSMIFFDKIDNSSSVTANDSIIKELKKFIKDNRPYSPDGKKSNSGYWYAGEGKMFKLTASIDITNFDEIVRSMKINDEVIKEDKERLNNLITVLNDNITPKIELIDNKKAHDNSLNNVYEFYKLFQTLIIEYAIPIWKLRVKIDLDISDNQLRLLKLAIQEINKLAKDK